MVTAFEKKIECTCAELLSLSLKSIGPKGRCLSPFWADLYLKLCHNLREGGISKTSFAFYFIKKAKTKNLKDFTNVKKLFLTFGTMREESDFNFESVPRLVHYLKFMKKARPDNISL